jgi:hypothetical protein
MRPSVGGPSGQAAGRPFFLEKEAKTFATGPRAVAKRVFQNRKIFLVLFFKKEPLLSYPTTTSLTCITGVKSV